MLQTGRRFAPRGDTGARRQIGFALRTALNPMVGKGAVAAILSRAAGHVAAQTVAVFRGMRGGKAGGVARQASRTEKLSGLGGRVMRIVACSAPQTPTAVARADA